MDSLSINGDLLPVKFNYTFYNRVLDHYDPSQKDADGFNLLISGLIAEDPSAIVKAYRFAIQQKSIPAAKDVEEALNTAGIWDTEDPFSDLYQQLRSVGFLRLKIRALLKSLKDTYTNSKAALDVVSGSLNPKSKNDRETKRQAEVEVELNKAAYEMAKKQLTALGKEE